MKHKFNFVLAVALTAALVLLACNVGRTANDPASTELEATRITGVVNMTMTAFVGEPTRVAAEKTATAWAVTPTATLAAPTEGVAPVEFVSWSNGEKPGIYISGVPVSVEVEDNAEYTNTIGYGTGFAVAEPGGLTADPHPEDEAEKCRQNPVCWIVSPDNQFKLTDPVSEQIDVREDAWTMVTFGGGTFQGTNFVLTLEEIPLHNWTVVFHGYPPADGDFNTSLLATYNPSFGTVTNIPVSARLSEDYVLQNTDNVYNSDVCAGGCLSDSIVVVDTYTGAWAAVHREGLNKPYMPIGSNIVGAQ